MKINLEEGRYVLAVSGGVDSMALLNMLSNAHGVELVVAHFNHGIRQNSYKDEALVRRTAERLGIEFESAKGKLGPDASEEAARNARYAFLESVLAKHEAKAIVTAHHQDDLIETAFINILRGTGRRGLVSLAVNPKVLRPLLYWTKQDILSYAKQHKLSWREDPSNQDEKYLRNYIRRQVMPGLSNQQRQQIIAKLDRVTQLESSINPEIVRLSRKVVKDERIVRRDFTALPVNLGDELVLYWLRQWQVRRPDKRTVKRLNLALRASKQGTTYSVTDGLSLVIGKDSAQFSQVV